MRYSEYLIGLPWIYLFITYPWYSDETEVLVEGTYFWERRIQSKAIGFQIGCIRVKDDDNWMKSDARKALRRTPLRRTMIVSVMAGNFPVKDSVKTDVNWCSVLEIVRTKTTGLARQCHLQINWIASPASTTVLLPSYADGILSLNPLTN